jgi:hypothetical protein
MKYLCLFFLVLLVVGCKSSQINTSLEELYEKHTVLLSNCIDNAVCNIELLPKSNLLIKEDEFKNTYIEFEKGNNTIIKYQLKKNELPNTADSHYSEIIYLEIDNYNKSLNLKNEDLQQVKMIYGRLCYCKGSSGYFKVNKGSLELILSKNKLSLNANFNVENIPQIVSQINEKISLQK